MRLSFLLFRRSLGQSWQRLLLIAGSVAAGVALLLGFTAYFNALTTNSEARTDWQKAINQQSHVRRSRKQIAGVDPVLVQHGQSDTIGEDNREVEVWQMEATGSKSPDLFGLTIPKPGEYYVSSALNDYIKSHPDDQIGHRYGTKQLGILPDQMVFGRDSYVVIMGYDVKSLVRNTTTTEFEVAADGSSSSTDGEVAGNESVEIYTFKPVKSSTSSGMRLTMAVIYLGIFILLFPVLLLVSISTRLGGVQREKRYAALRLVGATNGQVIGTIALESFISTVSGVVLGFAIYYLIRPIIGELRLAETRYFMDDIRVELWQGVVIAVGTVALSLIANWWGMRHVHTSPLGVTRNQKMERRPRIWRILPLAISVAGLIALQVIVASRGTRTMRMNVMLGVVVLMMLGLIWATPWLTCRLSSLVAHLTRRPVILLATKYIKSHSHSIARSVGGVVLALFAGSFFIMAVSGVYGMETDSVTNDPYSSLNDNTAITVGLKDGSELEDKLKSANYVKGYLKLDNYGSYRVGECQVMRQYIGRLDCTYGKLAALDTTVATDDDDYIIYANDIDRLRDKLKAVWLEKIGGDEQLADMNTTVSEGYSRSYLIKVNNAEVDKLRTLLRGVDDDAIIYTAKQAKTPLIPEGIKNLSTLAYFGMAVTMLVAIISIVVSTTGGLLERRRSLYTLRLGGMQVGELKRMVIIESLIPLIVTSLIAAGLGAWAAYVTLKIADQPGLGMIVTPTYGLIIIGSLVLATIAIYLVLPLLNRLTIPDANQTE